jgi:hypothetical protein
MTTKQMVEKIIHELPDDASMDVINYHLYVFEKISESDEHEKANGLIDHGDAKDRILKCLRG